MVIPHPFDNRYVSNIPQQILINLIAIPLYPGIRIN